MSEPFTQLTQLNQGAPPNQAAPPDASQAAEEAEARAIPINLYRHAAPLMVDVIENRRLTSPDNPNEVRHVVLRYPATKYHFLEGQSAGIPPPGLNHRGRAHVPRLYSIASGRDGDDGETTSLSLCVKRVIWVDENGVEQRGLASNLLCDAQVGAQLPMTGPAGKEFILPLPGHGPLILVATGTGIAPFRAFAQRWLQLPASQRAPIWLFFGVQTADDLLYADEWREMEKHAGFHVSYALSRQQKTADGRRLYVQERMRLAGAPLWDWIVKADTQIFICGIKGMEVGIAESLVELAQTYGKPGQNDWPTLQAEMAMQRRWHLEVY